MHIMRISYQRKKVKPGNVPKKMKPFWFYQKKMKSYPVLPKKMKPYPVLPKKMKSEQFHQNLNKFYVGNPYTNFTLA